MARTFSASATSKIGWRISSKPSRAMVGEAANPHLAASFWKGGLDKGVARLVPPVSQINHPDLPQVIYRLFMAAWAETPR
jgi:hypothetical protein